MRAMQAVGACLAMVIAATDATGGHGGGNISHTRQDKMFSLFSVVNFPNMLCRSTLGDNGTCITAPECIARSGQVAGTCASGFGACCVLYNRLCGGTVAYNNTYLVNPGYSSAYTTAGTCSWTIPKIRTDICLIRLDFD